MDGRIAKSSLWHFCCRSHTKLPCELREPPGLVLALHFLLLPPGSLVEELHPDPDYFDAAHRLVLDAFDVFLPFREKDEDCVLPF